MPIAMPAPGPLIATAVARTLAVIVAVSIAWTVTLPTVPVPPSVEFVIVAPVCVAIVFSAVAPPPLTPPPMVPFTATAAAPTLASIVAFSFAVTVTEPAPVDSCSTFWIVALTGSLIAFDAIAIPTATAAPPTPNAPLIAPATASVSIVDKSSASTLTEPAAIVLVGGPSTGNPLTSVLVAPSTSALVATFD